STLYIVLVRGTWYGCSSPRNCARRALVGAAPGLGTQYVGRTRYSEWQFTSLYDRQHLQILRLHIRRPIRRAIVLAPQRLEIVPQRVAAIHIERRVCTQRRAVPGDELVHHRHGIARELQRDQPLPRLDRLRAPTEP